MRSVVEWTLLLCIAAAAPLASSCDDENDGAGSTDAADGGPDGVGEGACPTEPTSCSDIGETVEQQYHGCCFGGSVYFCEDGVLETIDCEEGGYGCGYNAAGDFMDCV
jgi:hypothetical protein